MEIIELKKAGSVSAGQKATDTFTPGDGVFVQIREFYGEANFVSTTTVKLVWKYGHQSESEVVIWSTNGSTSMPFPYNIEDADGVRKLAVVCDNGSASSHTMSAYAKIAYI